MKSLILGDVHLGKGLSIGKPGSGGVLNSRLQDQINLLDWTLETAIENDVDTIIITGDIYDDARPHPEIIQIFMKWLKRCERHNIKVQIVVGNHDIIRSGNYSVSALDIIPAIELSHARTYKNPALISDGRISFVFLPYRDRRMYDAESPDKALELLREELKEITDRPEFSSNTVKVLVGHLTLYGALYVGDEIDDVRNELFCPMEMFNAFDYVWMGHIHRPQLMQDFPRVAHIGSMDKSDFGKNEIAVDKIIVIIDPDNPEFFREIKIPTRPLRNVKISVPPDKETTDFVINSLHAIDKEEGLADSIMRLEITLENPEGEHSDREKVMKFAKENLGVHHVTKFSETRAVVLVSVQESETEQLTDNMNIPATIDAFFKASDFKKEEDREEAAALALSFYEELKEQGKIK